METLSEYMDLCIKESREEFLRLVPHALLVELSQEGARARISRTVYQDEASAGTGGKAPLSDPEARVLKVVRRVSGAFASGEKVFFGRAPEADIQIALGTVSKSHAYISSEPAPGGFFICDLRSTNGTFINGRRLPSEQKKSLADGDVVSLGQEAHFAFFTASGLYDQYGLG